MRTKYLFLIAVALVSNFIGYGQIAISEEHYQQLLNIPQEKVSIHSNSDFALTGETLFYKFYCTNEKTNRLSTLSKYGYVEMVNEQKEAVIKQKVALTNGLGQGDIFIASDLPTGVYKLIGYTEWMKNKNLFFQKNIHIVNPFQKTTSVTNDQHQEFIPEEKEKNTSFFSTNQVNYTTREKVLIDFKTLSKELQGGNYSLSVVAKSPLSGILNKKTSRSTNNQKAQKSFDHTKVFLPEFRGEMIVGRIKAASSDTSLEKVQVALSIIQKNGISKIVKAQKDGRFYFVLDETYAGKNVFIQVLDEGEFSIELQKKKSPDYSSLIFPKMALDSTSIKHINERAIHMQIENAYNTVKQDSLKEIITSTPIFKNGALVYNLDDYTRFKTMRETFVEVINLASIERSKGKYIFRAKRNDFASNDPKALLIVDGYIVKNHDEIVELNPKEVRQISILKKSYKLSSKVYQGVIYIDTFKGNYQPREGSSLISFELALPTREKIYYSPDYTAQNLKRIPDYRSQLYWEPKVNTLKSTVSFFTSDVTGVFEIILEGYTKEGKWIRYKQSFDVKKK